MAFKKNDPKTKAAAKAGGSSKVSQALNDDQRKALAMKVGGILPLEFAASVLRDPYAPMKEKMWACELLMPYMHRKLPMAVDLTANMIITSIDTEAVSNMDDTDLDKLIEAVSRITQQKTV